MPIRFDMVGIFVRDIGRMAAFYRDVLGFATDWNGQGPYAEFHNDGVRFSMYERSELPKLLGREPSYPAGINGTFELAVDLPGTADVDGEYARVVGLGAQGVYAPREEPWGMYSSMVADPEGNLIEIGSWKKGVPPEFRLGVVTVAVSDMARSRAFYEGLLGFKPGAWYEPTRWLSYNGGHKPMFAIEERDGWERQKSDDTIDFYLDGVDGVWERVKGSACVVEELKRTPWGSYKFVIRDPDGYCLGFVKNE